MSGIQRQALERTAMLVRLALDPTTPGEYAGPTALRACALLRDYELLPEMGAQIALKRAVWALATLLLAALDGCEHAPTGLLCSHCERTARAAAASARIQLEAIEGRG